jgi:hypothetical protein
MSTNVSKQKRKELTDKIKAIHKYIATAKQDENTRNLITWLSDIDFFGEEFEILKSGIESKRTNTGFRRDAAGDRYFLTDKALSIPTTMQSGEEQNEHCGSRSRYTDFD